MCGVGYIVVCVVGYILVCVVGYILVCCRVQGVLMQIEPFATVFQCKEGSTLKLHKGQLCPIWT